jgi:hypothetical protein
VQIMAGWNLVDNMTEYADYLEYKYGWRASVLYQESTVYIRGLSLDSLLFKFILTRLTLTYINSLTVYPTDICVKFIYESL